MSGYGQAPSAVFLHCEPSGGLHERHAFGPYAPPPYTAPLGQAYSVRHGPDEDRLDYRSPPELDGFQQVEAAAQTTSTDPRLHHFPQIHTLSQMHGAAGSTVRLHLQSPYEFRQAPPINFYLLFASKCVECGVQLISDRHASPKQYTISAEVPALASTSSRSVTIPLRMMMAGGNNDRSASAVDVGVFTYTDQSTPQDPSRKRRLSSISEDTARRLARKQSAQQLGPEVVGDTAWYGGLVATPISNPASRLGTEAATPPRALSHNCSASVTSAPSIRAPTPCTPASSSPSVAALGGGSNGGGVGAGSDATATSASHDENGDATVGSKTPALIRTSTLQQSPQMAAATTAPQPFNPYAMYPCSKAVLKLNGDLNSVVHGWSGEEWDAKRRLVQFTRQQNGSTIHADFRVIAPEDRQASTICVSCIWWKEKGECYVTSVDTISLLESLVDVRFTVEEKNRIRRNLEGYRPLTVSKSKDDSEAFFKIIMGFPNPKPRHIEKDVKVFPWRILATALKKIIGKYSASYASAASALSNPPAARYASSRVGETATDGRISQSPQRLDDDRGHGASAYSVPTAAATVSTSTCPTSVGLPLSNDLTDLRLQVAPDMPPFAYALGPSYSAPAPYPHHFSASSVPMTAPATTGRFDASWRQCGDDMTTAAVAPTAATTSLDRRSGRFDGGAMDSRNAYRYDGLLHNLAPTSTLLPTSYSLSPSGI